MPQRVEPCLALLASKPPVGRQWAFEIKWDGYRLALHLEQDKMLRILTRGGHDWTNLFPSIARETLALKADTAILDGEAVVLDKRGASDFSALQKALGGRSGRRQAKEAIFYAFDLLYLNGRDLRALSLTERRAMLQDLVGNSQGAVRLSEELETDGETFLRLACEMGLEGIIAKRRDKRYRSGRGGDWLKIKCIQSETFVIIGYEPSTAAIGGIGRLLLAARKGDSLAYVGGVGTGFTYVSGRALKRMMDKLVIEKPVIPLKRKGAIWLTPALAAEIKFRGWTDEPKLRHASYKGLREEAEMGEVYRLEDEGESAT